MTKNRAILIIGVILALWPFMGFPSSWENFFHFIFGIILIALAFSVSMKYRERRVASRRTEPTRREGEIPMFVDTAPRKEKMSTPIKIEVTSEKTKDSVPMYEDK